MGAFMSRVISAVKPYLDRRVLTMAVLGFPYGMMFFLGVQTLQLWLTEEGISTAEVGFFSFVTLPYIFKVYWAPLINFIPIPLLSFLGARRSWLIFSHLSLIVLLNLIAWSNPSQNLLYVGVLSFSLLIFASIQDIVVDAYRIEILKKDQAGPGIGMLTAGYRLGSFAATFGTLTIADSYSWQMAYTVMSALVSMGIVAALLNPEPEMIRQKVGEKVHFLRQFFENLVPPFQEFFSRPGWIYVVVFILSYRIGDAFINTMVSPFYIQLGFTKAEIADITKFFGVLPTLAGGLIGGALATRINIYTGLLGAGLLHALTHIMFILQAMRGYDPDFLYYVIFLENITGGITTAIFLLYLSREAHPKYIPTQYAFFTSLWSLPTFLAGISGELVELLGHDWPTYFEFCLLISLPSLGLIFVLRRYPLLNAGGLGK